MLGFADKVFPRWLQVGLLLVTAIRLAVAGSTPLSPDEAYYWIWSKTLSPGYLDHPPMVAFWIKAGTLIAGDTALGVRLLGPFSAMFGTVLLLRAAEDLWPDRSTGAIAACLLNATLALNVGAVVMTPDTPLLFFWTAALFALARLIRTERPIWWLMFGLFFGCALDSKYTGLLLGIAVLVWVIASRPARRWLLHWQLYAGGGIAFLCFLPVLVWNDAHHWASILKQGGRTSGFITAGAGRFVSELVGGQALLATPILAVMFALGVTRAAKRYRISAAHGLIACVTLVPAAVFLEHALGARVQANWPGIIYPGAALAAAALAPRFWRPGVALGFVLSTIVFIQASAAPMALPRWLDFSLVRLAGWQNLAGEVFAAETRASAGYVATDEYGLASALAFRLRSPVVSIEVERWGLFALPHMALGGQVGLLVLSDRSRNLPDPKMWSSAVLFGRVQRGRHGQVAETYRLYRVVGAPEAMGIDLPVQQELRGKLAAN